MHQNLTVLLEAFYEVGSNVNQICIGLTSWAGMLGNEALPFREAAHEINTACFIGSCFEAKLSQNCSLLFLPPQLFLKERVTAEASYPSQTR